MKGDIILSELQAFKEKHQVIYAITGTKRMILTLNNNIEVWKKEKNEWIQVWQGMQLFPAVEIYNELP